MQMQMKNILYKIITGPLLLLVTVMEWLFKLLLKISTVAAGLLINVLLICMFISIWTRQWILLGILTLCATIVLLLVYGETLLLYKIGEAREFIDLKRWLEGWLMYGTIFRLCCYYRFTLILHYNHFIMWVSIIWCRMRKKDIGE